MHALVVVGTGAALCRGTRLTWPSKQQLQTRRSSQEMRSTACTVRIEELELIVT